MATVKKSNKKKIIIPIAIILVIAIIVSSIFIVKAKTGVTEVTLTTIATDSIVESVSATGDVTSGTVKEYKVGTVATVKEVFVKPGDQVKEGQMLATFDTSSLDSEVKKLQSAYSSANQSYNAALKAQNEAKSNLAKVNKQLKAVNKSLSKAKKDKTTTKKQTTTKKVTTTKAPTSSTTSTTIHLTTTTQPATTTTTKHYSSVSDALADLVVTIDKVAEEVTNISNNIQASTAITEIVMTAIAEEIAKGTYSPDAIADAVGTAMEEAIRNGMIEFIDSGAAVDMITAAVKSVDWEAIGAGLGNTANAKIASLELQVAALTAQKEIYTAAANGAGVKAQKSVRDSAKSALDAVKSAQEDLSAGWKADFEGTITECDIKPGQQTSLVSSGIKLENMNSLVVTISLGEYDIHKVKVGMPATIKTAYGEYTGEVSTIAPTATGGSSSSIMNSVGSMAGISGLSSLTDSGAGVKCEIIVNEPDENIIVGFEASVVIQTGEFDSIPSVPIESIILEKEGTYVYLYDEETSTVTKTKIETGAISDTAYEIKSGLNIGDQIVSIPSADYKEETFEVKVKNK